MKKRAQQQADPDSEVEVTFKRRMLEELQRAFAAASERIREILQDEDEDESDATNVH